MYGWNERPSKATAKNFIGGDNPAAIYEVGQYQVTVHGGTPDEHPEVTYCHKYRNTTDPRATLPNMEIADGEIRIPVTDLVGEALKRLEPAELAAALWSDDSVKAEFMELLTRRYNDHGIDDGDRRKFLAGVKEAVHDKRLDDLANAMSKLEYEFSKTSHFYHEINRINEALRHYDVRIKRGDTDELLQFNNLDRSTKGEDGGFTRGELEIGGKSWEEARTHWRKEVSARFPNPVA